MFSSVLSLVNSAIGGISNYFIKDQEIIAQKQQFDRDYQTTQLNGKLSLAKVKIEGQIQQARAAASENSDLDKMSMNEMKGSLKDEYLLFLFSVPIIMAFIPGLQGYVADGFKIVKDMPYWYISIIIGMNIVVFGLRGLFIVMLKRQNKLHLN